MPYYNLFKVRDFNIFERVSLRKKPNELTSFLISYLKDSNIESWVEDLQQQGWSISTAAIRGCYIVDENQVVSVGE